MKGTGVVASIDAAASLAMGYVSSASAAATLAVGPSATAFAQTIANRNSVRVETYCFVCRP